MTEEDAYLILAKYRKGQIAANAVIISSLVALGLVIAGPSGFDVIPSFGGESIEVTK